MTESSTAEPLEAAVDAADAAATMARASGLTVRELTEPDQYHEAQRLLMRVWRTDDPPMPAELMRALSHAGGYVAGASLDGRLVGVAVGFVSHTADGPAVPRLHSHITGVAPEAQGRRVGLALKLHQRAWALRHGIDTIMWTFDPLVRRNAFFNLTKLAASADSYLVDFYGPMSDGINAGQGSDRLLLRWPLLSPAVSRAAAGQVREAAADETLEETAVLLRTDADNRPRAGTRSRAGTLLCAVPEDIELIRQADPALARAWRHGVRDALGGAMADGYLVTGFARAGWYVLTTGGETR